MKFMSIREALLAIAICAVVVTPAVQAQTNDANLHIHGFGDWVFGKTDGNEYQSANEGGRYDDAAVGLNLRYDASEKVAIVSQIAWEHAEGRAADAETLLDYAFVQYTYSDRLHVRLGRTYHPFGIYSEIRDIGTARPFLEQPPEIYGELGIVSSSLEGVNLYGSLPSATNWGLHYDLYGGATELPVIEVGSEEGEEEISRVHDVVGGRLTLETPVSGLRASVSAFNGKLEQGDNPGETHRSIGAAIDYVTDRLWLRAETARHEEDDESARGTYLEAAYRLSGPLQLTGRWGTIDSEFPEKDTIEGRFFRQRDVAAGLNFWLDPKVVIKTELHFLNGNRFALSDPVDDTDEKTRVFQAGVQFSF